MDDFLVVIFSKGRSARVPIMRELLGEILFSRVHWFVAMSEGPSYKGAGACHVKETGTIAETLSVAVNKAHTQKRPLAFCADDVAGVHKLSGSTATWQRELGRPIGVLQAAHEILVQMQKVGAPLGGVYPCNDVRCQLQMPPVSYCHYFSMDFIVVDTSIPIQISIPQAASPKEDYHLCASVLMAFGVTCRLNHLCAHASHYTKGGAGDKNARADRDRAAACWLLSHWNKQESVVFSRSTRGDAQIRLSNGLALVKRAHPDKVEAHQKLAQAIGCTRLDRTHIAKVITTFKKQMQVGKNKQAKKKHLSRIELQRQRRGSGAFVSRKGRPLMALTGRKLTSATRAALSRAKSALRALVLG